MDLQPTLVRRVRQGRGGRGRWGCSPGCSEWVLSGNGFQSGKRFWVGIVLHHIINVSCAQCLFLQNIPGERVGSSWTVVASRCTCPGRAHQEPSSDLQLWFPGFSSVDPQSSTSGRCSPSTSQFSVLNSQFPIPNSQFPILNSRFSILNSQLGWSSILIFSPSTSRWSRWRQLQGAPSRTQGPVGGKPLLLGRVFSEIQLLVLIWSFVKRLLRT